MALNNKQNIHSLFDRKTSSAEVLAEKTEKEAERDVLTWDDLFFDLFEYKEGEKNILEQPRNTTVLVQRNMPILHTDNIWGYEVRLPVMFTFDDSNSERWWGYVYNFYSEEGWKFVMMKPDRLTLLEYIKGKITLQEVYDSTEHKFLVTPNIDKMLIEVPFDELPDTAKPIEDSVYNSNIWLDEDDMLFGMNMIDVAMVQDLAKHNRFYSQNQN